MNKILSFKVHFRFEFFFTVFILLDRLKTQKTKYIQNCKKLNIYSKLKKKRERIF